VPESERTYWVLIERNSKEIPACAGMTKRNEKKEEDHVEHYPSHNTNNSTNRGNPNELLEQLVHSKRAFEP